MKTIDQILQLIDTGDAADILAAEDITRILNELHRYEMIDLQEGKLLLTSKGREAREKGFREYLKNLSRQKPTGNLT